MEPNNHARRVSYSLSWHPSHIDVTFLKAKDMYELISSLDQSMCRLWVLLQLVRWELEKGGIETLDVGRTGDNMGEKRLRQE